MMRIEALRALEAAAERLLRQRAAERGRDAEASVAQLREALALGRIQAACVYDDAGVAYGFAAWRWRDAKQTHAQVLVCYVASESPPDWGQALVEHVFTALRQSSALTIVEVRVRDQSPGVREAWQRRDLVLFERCRMVRPLNATPIPVLPSPDQIQIVPWRDEFRAEVEHVAVGAHQDGIEAAAAPYFVDAGHVVERLRRLWAGQLSGVDTWNPGASLVAVHRQRTVVGYIVLAHAGQEAHIIDLAVAPAHQHRGIAQALMMRSMTLCLKQQVQTVVLPLTTGNPAQITCAKLGFHAADCGEVAMWWRDGRQLKWRR